MSFLGNMYTVFMQVLTLAIMIAVGFTSDKLGVFTEKSARMCNNMLFYVITPCVIVNSFLSVEYTSENAKGFFTALACAAILHILGMIVTRFVFNKGDKSRNAVFKYACMYGNMGYMGLPLTKAVLDAVAGNGELGSFYCSAAVICFNAFAFSHGAYIMSGGEGEKFDRKKIVINPGVISVAIGLPLFLFKVKFPGVLQTPISSIGSMNTPLAMMMLGTYLANANIKDALKEKNVFFTAFLKLIAFPLFLICGFRLCGITGNVLIAASVFVATPTATNTAMFAAKFDKDTALASQVCGFSTMLSIFTIPVCTALGVLIS